MLKELEKTISPVLVVNNSSLKPYVELFEYYPENIYQQPLGSLVGFFEIKEYSEESAYIVNFLTSVLKKEYYANPKRPVAESFDSALHKINVALSELAKQGNVEWLGNLHAAICVLEKNNAHFSVAGKAKIFLYRNRVLSDISDGLASDSTEPHPLKTFVNVSSGRLEKGDRLLITPEDIFHILPLAELRKNFQRLEGNKFVQFLKTALSNQLEMIAIAVIEMLEAKPAAEVKISNSGKRSPVAANAFSEKTFAKTQFPKIESEKELEKTATDSSEDLEYTDKKTGHIYVQGETDETGQDNQANLYWDMTKEKIAQAWYSGKNALRRRISIYKKQLEKKRQLRLLEREKQKKIETEAEKIRLAEEKELIRELELQKQAEAEQERELKMAEEEARRQQKSEEIVPQPEPEEQPQNEKIEITEQIERFEQSEKPEEKRLSFREKLELVRKSNSESPSENIYMQSETDLEIEYETEPVGKNSKLDILKSYLNKTDEKVRVGFAVVLKWISATTPKLGMILKSAYSKAGEIIGKMHFPSIDKDKILRFVPRFYKIRKIFSAFTFKQKAYTVLALILIFVVPIFIVRWTNRPKPPTITELVTLPPTPAEILTADKNINLAPAELAVLSKSDIIDVLSPTAGTVAVTKTGVAVIASGQQKEYALPTDSGSAVRAAYMKDLALVLILTDQNKVISFSPVTSKFTANNFNLPSGASADFIGTYLTYMYVLDSKANQIYRYPRATGGFGDKTNWLKDATTLSGVSDMTIDDSLYLVRDNQIIKLFKGKITPFDLEASKTPVHFDKIFTTIDSASLYVLDTKNSRIVQYSKADGTITAQYFDEKLSGDISLSVDEQNKLAYIATSSGLISISL